MHGGCSGVQASCTDLGEDALSCITEVLLLLPDGDDNVAADAYHTLDTLDLGPVAEAPSGGARIGDRIGLESQTSRGKRHPRDSSGVWMEAPSGGQTQFLGSAVARATPVPLERVARTAGFHPGVHVGPRAAVPTQQCHRSCTGGCASLLP